jgi:hypothetical protein
MVWLTRLSRFTLLAVLAVALTLGLAVNVPAQVPAPLRSTSLSSKLENAFRAPQGPGAPTPVNTEGGASRNPCIASKNTTITALLPVSRIGETIAEYPTIFWYMPKIAAETEAPGIKFVLKVSDKQQDSADKPIVYYSTEYPLAKSAEGVVGAPGIMSLSLTPSNFPSLSSLEIDKEYAWELTMSSCDYTDSDKADEIMVDGGIKRVKLDPTLARRIQQATPQERVALYAENKLWYETLSSLVELRRTNPNDQNLEDAWDKLLSSVGLDIISKEPLFQGARPFNTSRSNP